MVLACYWERGTSSMIKRDTEFQPVFVGVVGVSISCTDSNVDSNSDFALVYVVTVALNEPGSVVVFTSIWDPQHRVNRQGTTALGAIESDEPSLIAVVTTSQIEVSLVNN